MYNKLSAEKSLLDLQPGDIVKVSAYCDDGVAQITFSNEHGYIARTDLTTCLGKTQ